ncbi:hypothetical protein IRZ71_20775 [Flavobacterium sp. ANB]|uniref:hypothetical protein n=1 Tax=unclassified Flavobacterium TaxID=196869 RepID=UPI0012B9D5C7|nr:MULTISPECIES: hypothetical protein [unclassified Flavobacterium]MBF4518797.1 hypothetical protein [Flavobacterium sp. ANB]MTD71490.1 hypothetical protein [Flavobacterium sp. LC2016-13]
MTTIHTLITIGGFCLMLLFFQLIRNGIKQGDYGSFMDDMYFNEKMNGGIFISFLSIVGVQSLFFINIIQSLIKKIKSFSD